MSGLRVQAWALVPKYVAEVLWGLGMRVASPTDMISEFSKIGDPDIVA